MLVHTYRRLSRVGVGTELVAYVKYSKSRSPVTRTSASCTDVRASTAARSGTRKAGVGPGGSTTRSGSTIGISIATGPR